MARKNNTFLYVIVGILALVAIYFVWQQTSKTKKKSAESYTPSGNIKEHDMELVQQADSSEPDRPHDDFQLLDEPDPAAFEIGFGMGPGIYGSGRHTSEMIGN